MISDELQRCGVFFDVRAKEWRADGKSFLGEAIRAIHDNLEKAKPRKISAFWRVKVYQYLRMYGGRDQQRTVPLVPQLEAIFNKTAERLGNFGPRDLATTALAFAEIIKVLGEGTRTSHHIMHMRGSYDELLNKVLVDRRDIIFQLIANTAKTAIGNFDARYLNNLAMAYAIIEYDPKFDDGGTLLNLLAKSSILLLEDFKPQQLATLVWSFATVGVSHPLLFEKVADHIISLDNLGAIKPQQLSDLVWAFAKAEVFHPGLFEKVASHIVALDDLNELMPHQISNFVWAFSQADVHNPQLCMGN